LGNENQFHISGFLISGVYCSPYTALTQSHNLPWGEVRADGWTVARQVEHLGAAVTAQQVAAVMAHAAVVLRGVAGVVATLQIVGADYVTVRMHQAPHRHVSVCVHHLATNKDTLTIGHPTQCFHISYCNKTECLFDNIKCFFLLLDHWFCINLHL